MPIIQFTMYSTWHTLETKETVLDSVEIVCLNSKVPLLERRERFCAAVFLSASYKHWKIAILAIELKDLFNLERSMFVGLTCSGCWSSTCRISETFDPSKIPGSDTCMQTWRKYFDIDQARCRLVIRSDWLALQVGI